MGGWPDPIIGPGGDYRVLFFSLIFFFFFLPSEPRKQPPKWKKKSSKTSKKKTDEEKEEETCCIVLLGFTQFFFGFTQFDRVVPSFTGFYLVSLGYRVLFFLSHFLSFSFHPHLENNHRNGENKFLEMFKKKDEEKEEETFLSLSLKCSFIFFLPNFVASTPFPLPFWVFVFFSFFFLVERKKKKLSFGCGFPIVFFPSFIEF